MRYTKTLSPALLVLLASCTWVPENPAQQSIVIASSNLVSGCQKKGDASIKVKYKIGFYKRDSRKVLMELQTLARNEAIKLGADTIVANAAPTEGRQTYQAYKCY
ncbi:MAG: hypothetical protein ACI82Z_001838 [Cellvibrionaceae bacterium]|jgi:hypothetical protein